MKHIVRLLLALILCGCVVLFPVRAQTIDPAAEVEQYLRYGVWFLCGFYILGRLLELVRKTK